MVPAELISEHPRNRNKQNRHVHSEIKESMQENGFDETLLLTPRTDGKEGYWCVSGNHRYRAGKSLGMTEFPATIHKDWDAAKQQVELLRRNMIRGTISKPDFTLAANDIKTEANYDMSVLSEELGFENPEKFAEMYQLEQEQTEQRMVYENITQIAQKARITEDLGLVISALLEKHGDTVPYSFLVFPTGGKNHVFIQSSPTLKRTLDMVFTKCIHDNLDVNVVMGALLHLGMASTNFRTPEAKIEEIKAAGTESGDSDIKELV
jgi:hypothetical protein